MLSVAQKTAVRHHLGIPFAGTAQAGRLYGWRFTWFNEDVEYRMNNMQPQEEQLLTGATLGSWRIDGATTIGDVVSFTVTDTVQSTTVSYTVQASDFTLVKNSVNPSESSPLYSIALNASMLLNNKIQVYGYTAVGVMPADLISPQYLSPYFSEILITGPGSGTAFTLTSTSGTTTNVYVQAAGAISPVRASITDAATGLPVSCYGYIQICDYLSNLMTTANLSLTYAKADVVNFRPDEVHARRKLYSEYCNKLKRVIGGEEYVKKFGGRGTVGASA